MKQPNLHKNKLTDKETIGAYHLEKALATKLRESTRAERRKLYNMVYAEYYEKFPNQPFIVRDEDEIKRSTVLQMKYLRKFLKPNMVFLEIGPGSGALAAEVAKYVKTVYVIDVSDAPLMGIALPSNVVKVVSNGVNLPDTIKAVDIAYSSQVMEHLHPDDALEQVKDIYNVLNSGSVYICRTPHRYSGPHDISEGFDNVATCFHLKEYTISELISIFRTANFRKVSYEITPKGRSIAVPISLIRVIEKALSCLSFRYRRVLTKNFPLKPFFNFSIIGIK